MKRRFLFFFRKSLCPLIPTILTICLCFTTSAVYSQGYYKVVYQFYDDLDGDGYTEYYGPIYEALLVDYGSEESLMRIRYTTDGVSYEIVEQKIHSYQEDYTSSDGSHVDRWVYKGQDVRSIVGAEEGYYPDVIVLKQVNGYYEPDFVYSHDGDEYHYAAISVFEPLDVNGITNDFLGLYDWRWAEDSEEEVSFDLAASKLHLILVSATEDIELSSGFEKNHKRIHALFKGAASAAGIGFSATEIKGNDFSKSEIDAKLSSLQVKQNQDIVIFYYSGHGFRYDDQAEKWPQMALTYTVGIDFSDPGNTAYTYNLKEVYDQLIQKNARLTIAIGECCNVGAGFTTPVAVDYPRIAPSGFPFNKASLHKIFSSKGNILLATAGPGEYSMYYPQSGGYFCNSFYKSFMTQTGKGHDSNVTWESILNSAIDGTKKHAIEDKDRSNNQVPISIINVD